jgi:1-acyl-sn-glycerol-3-phosphate acyltransferase
MSEKKPQLERIAENLDLTVTGIEQYPTDKPSLVVANHTSMKDIFMVSSALPEATKIVLSARLMWKANTVETSLRRLLIEQSLYGIPLEVHGGQERLQAGFEMAKRALSEGWSVIIFPEGAYTGDRYVTKGRTGASRILFDASQEGIDAHLLPVGIRTEPDADGLDEFVPDGDKSLVSIGKPIDYSEHYNSFRQATGHEEKKAALRAPIDIAMRATAELAGYSYLDEYIWLRPRDTLVLESGEEVLLEHA